MTSTADLNLSMGLQRKLEELLSPSKQANRLLLDDNGLCIVSIYSLFDVALEMSLTPARLWPSSKPLTCIVKLTKPLYSISRCRNLLIVTNVVVVIVLILFRSDVSLKCRPESSDDGLVQRQVSLQERM